MLKGYRQSNTIWRKNDSSPIRPTKTHLPTTASSGIVGLSRWHMWLIPMQLFKPNCSRFKIWHVMSTYLNTSPARSFLIGIFIFICSNSNRTSRYEMDQIQQRSSRLLSRQLWTERMGAVEWSNWKKLERLFDCRSRSFAERRFQFGRSHSTQLWSSVEFNQISAKRNGKCSMVRCSI